jgi:hypothetical protein
MEMMKMPIWTLYLVYAFAFAVLSYAKEGKDERMAMDSNNPLRSVPIFMRARNGRIFKKVQRAGDN